MKRPDKNKPGIGPVTEIVKKKQAHSDPIP